MGAHPTSQAKALAAHQAFYPAAALYGAAALPLSVLAMTGHAAFLPALALPSGHAHEMLLGFALAVVAGNQLGMASAKRVAALLVLWAAARISFLAAPWSVVAAAINAAFAAGFALQVAPRLFGSAKKLRNQALPAILASLCVAAVAWQLTGLLKDAAPARIVVMLLALLMLFMGGRVIAPAVAGQLQRQGTTLQARVQPRLEGALLAAGALAILTEIFAGPSVVSGTLLAAAGLLAAVRLARWRVWALRGRADLLCLAAGYAWLALGLVALGAVLASGPSAGRAMSAAIHLITVGAIGTLTFNVMALSWKLKARRLPQEGSGAIVLGTALVAAATLARVAAALVSAAWLAQALLLLAAAAWACAFLVLLGIFQANRRPA